MREYTFLGSKSFRSEHVKAKNLREAFIKTKLWYFNLSEEMKSRFGILRGQTYQWCGENDFIMSGWIYSRDNKLKDIK